MSGGFYFKIAKTNIKNNRKIYFPYILTSVCMVMVLYIVSFLSNDIMIKRSFDGGATLQSILNFGVWVIVIFSALFLFYTNSFITKRRKREFGLMSVLGMGKKNIAALMLCENLIVDFVSVGGGLLLGMLFSKLVQGALYGMLELGAADFDFSPNTHALILALAVFLVIFTLIYLDSIRQTTFSSTVELLHSSDAGEREPKANYIMALLGVLLLGAGYVMSQRVRYASEALVFFFIAVILVILGTYALFISGSVALTKALKKKKSYYYTPSHFISVSGMSYRMKRNGAGLASICILSTMVLVMISATLSLFMGIGDTSRHRFPMDMTVFMGREPGSADDTGEFRDAMYSAADELGIEVTEEIGYIARPFYRTRTEGNSFDLSVREVSSDEDDFVLNLISVDDYNKYNTAGETIALEDGEVFVLTYDMPFDYGSIFLDGVEYGVAGGHELGDSFTLLTTMNYMDCPHLIVFLPTSVEEFMSRRGDDGLAEHEYGVHYYLGWNVYPNDRESMSALDESVYNIWLNGNGGADWELNGFYSGTYSSDFSYAVALYGGLFFIAVILGLVFMAGAVLIMYYKQVTEGYEDASRYEIMKKVGMTEREIKKSVNSQILTVFFSPLIVSGVHMAFAYNMINIILGAFLVISQKTFLITALVCYAVFALFYVAVYLITSKAYFKTISRGGLASVA